MKIDRKMRHEIRVRAKMSNMTEEKLFKIIVGDILATGDTHKIEQETRVRRYFTDVSAEVAAGTKIVYLHHGAIIEMRKYPTAEDLSSVSNSYVKELQGIIEDWAKELGRATPWDEQFPDVSADDEPLLQSMGSVPAESFYSESLAADVVHAMEDLDEAKSRLESVLDQLLVAKEAEEEGKIQDACYGSMIEEEFNRQHSK